jgi:hypothetical protein
MHSRTFVHPPTHSLLSSLNERYRHPIVLLTVYWKVLPVNHTIWRRILERLQIYELERKQKDPVIVWFQTVFWNLSREAEEIDRQSQSMVLHALYARWLQQELHIRVPNILYCHCFISKGGFQVTKQILSEALLHRTWEIIWFIFWGGGGGIKISISFLKQIRHSDPPWFSWIQVYRVNSYFAKMEFIFLPRAQQPLVGQGLLINEPSKTHSDTPHSVWLLWTSDQPDAQTSLP